MFVWYALLLFGVDRAERRYEGELGGMFNHQHVFLPISCTLHSTVGSHLAA